MKFQEKLARFMYGRYGMDDLYRAMNICELILLFGSIILNFLGKVEPILGIVADVLFLIALVLMGFGIYRFLSRNFPKRRKENEAWLRFKAKFRRAPRPSLPADTSDHVFRACPKCRATLRLPRQKGKHEARCPRCGEKFGVKVK